ncbi:MAG: Ig-like domain-containing protein [Hoeflea sp. D1-CHI-28]
MAYDISALTPQEQITALYVAYYDRAPDPGGLAFWTGQLEEFLDGAGDGQPGMSLNAIANSFANAQESKDLYPFLDGQGSSGAFLTNVYINLFGRLPDTEGLQFWQNNIDNGNIPVGEALLQIMGGAQGSDITVLESKIDVAIDWTESAVAFGKLQLSPEDEAEARSILDGVKDPATANEAKATTDAYFNNAPTASSEFVSVNEDGTIINGDVGDNTNDPDGDTLTHTVEAGDGPSNGTVSMNADGTYTYTPNANYNGADSFTYTVSDGNGGTDTGTVSITVTAVNDAPVGAPAAATTNEDTALNASVAATDVDGDALSFSVQAGNGPSNGSVTMNPNGSYTYTPNANFNGTDSFTYTVSDGNGGTGTETVTVTVNAVNDAPVAAGATPTTNEDTALNASVTATDVDGDALTFALATQAGNGTVVMNPNGSYTYTPNANFNGTDTFTYSVSDGNGGTDTETVSITVNPVNDLPVPSAQSVTTLEDVALQGAVSATDADGDVLTFSVEAGDGPSNGTLVMQANGTYTYTPNADYNGTDSFTYTVTDGNGAPQTATVTIDVTPVSDVLTPGTDTLNGGANDDTYLGADSRDGLGGQNELNAGDSVNGAGGNNTLVFNTSGAILGGSRNYSAFTLMNVQTFQHTNDSDETTIFDMSSSNGVQTYINKNSTDDVVWNFANLNPDMDGDSRPEVNLIVDNLTGGSDTSLDIRNGDFVSFPNAEVNLTVLDSDTNLTDAGDINIDMQVNTIDLDTGAANGSVVSIADLNSGNTFLNIATENALVIGDPDGDAGLTGPIGSREITGFENPLSAATTQIDASASTNGVNASARNASGNVTFQGGSGNDMFEGGQGTNDTLFGNDGADIIDGHTGNDSIDGGAGRDVLLGNAGNDTILGQDGNDVIDGGDGSDSILGGDNDDDIHTGSAFSNANQVGAAATDDEIVDAGAGNDDVTTVVQFLDGTDENGGALNLVDQLSGGDDFDNLFLTGMSSTDVNGLNFVQQFENIELDGTGTHTFTIGNGSVFETEHDARVGGGGTETTVDGRSSGGSLNLDFSTLDEKMNVIDSVNNDTIIGSRGDDDIFFSLGNDNLVGGAGNDEFIGDPDNIEFNDTIDGDGGNDTIVASGRGTANIGANVVGIETLKAEDLFIGDQGNLIVNIGDGTAPNNFTNNDLTSTSHDGTLSNGGNPRIHIDGSDLDLGEELFVNFNNTVDEDIQVTGGASNDIINMGTFLDAGDQIEGGDNRPVDVTENTAGNISSTTQLGDILVVDLNGGTLNDAAFANVSGIETLRVIDTAGGGTLNLGPNAAAAGIQVVDASGVVNNGTTINAQTFGNDLTVIDSNANMNINTGGGNDTILLAGGTDNVNTGGGADIIEVEGTDLDFTDTINGGSGSDSVKLMNQTGPAAGIVANVDLDTVSSIENYVMEGNGNRTVGVDADIHSITFQGGNIGTVTPILIDSSNVTDADDTLNVTIAGDGAPGGVEDVDADFAFTVMGGAGVDNFTKNNIGLNNNIDWDGGANDDMFSIAGGDMGSSTTINGNTGTDTLNQLTGTFIDDDFTNVSSMEVLTGVNQVVATLGAEADEAGIVTINGGAGNDNVVLDAAFDNDLDVNLFTGGNDTINGGASTATLTFNAHFDDFTAADSLTGGLGNQDTVNIFTSGSNQTADLSGMRGVEIINVGEDFSGTYTIELGTGGGSPTALTINADGRNGTGNWDGENLVVNGGNYGAAITYNGQVGSTGAKDILTTGNSADNIFTGDDNDNVVSNGGNDTVDGGAGNDTVDGGTGADIIDGGADNDVLFGGAGNFTDTIDGGTGNDTITGGGDGAVGEVLSGGEGADDFRYVNVTDSDGLIHDTIDDFVSGTDQIMVEETVLQDAGGGATAVNFIGNAPNFAQAQGAIGATGNDGVADWVFQAGNAVEAPTIWIDVDDNGILNGQDLQIELTGSGVTSMVAGDLYLTDSVAPDAPTFTSVTVDSAGPNGAADDFETNDNTAPVVRVSFSTATDGTGARVGDVLDVNGLPGGAQQKVLDATDISNGYVDITLPAGPIADGTYNMSATITDTFGTIQVSAAANQDLVIDTTATVAITGNNWGANGINGVEDDAVAVSGTTTGVEAGQTVTVSFNGGAVTATAVVQAGGTWALTGAEIKDLSGLPQGNLTVDATVTDQQGNVANAAQVVTTHDSLASINITAPIEGDDIVNAAEDNDVLVSGTVTNVEDGQTVVVTFDDGVNPPVSSAPVVIAGGAWDLTGNEVDISGLNDGNISVTAAVSDVAGNQASQTNFIVKDATPPAINFADVQSNYSTDSGVGVITLVSNVPLDPSDTVDVTALQIDDNGGGGYTLAAGDVASVVQTTSSITITLTAAGTTALQAAENMGSGIDSAFNVNAGFLTDSSGNASTGSDHVDISLDIRASDDGLAFIRGNSFVPGNDVLELDNLGVTAHGAGGADTFHLDNIYGGGGVIADIDDFDVTEGDLIQLDASDVNGFIAGSNPYSSGDDGAAVAFSTFNSGSVTAATNIEGTLIYDEVNKTLRIDYNGDTSWDGATLTDVGGEDDIIDLTGISGPLTASDIFFSG